MSDLRKILGKLLEEQDVQKERSLIELNMAAASKTAAKQTNSATSTTIAQNQKIDPVAVAKQSLLKAWNDINFALKDQNTKGAFDSSPEIKNILKLIKSYAQKDAAAQQPPAPVAPAQPAPAVAPAPAQKNPGVS